MSWSNWVEKFGRAWFLAAKLGDPKPRDEVAGWPEFDVTLTFYVTSDDPDVMERERRRVFEILPDAVLNSTGRHGRVQLRGSDER